MLRCQRGNNGTSASPKEVFIIVVATLVARAQAVAVAQAWVVVVRARVAVAAWEGVANGSEGGETGRRGAGLIPHLANRRRAWGFVESARPA